MAGRGRAWLGSAGRGVARHGEAWQGFFSEQNMTSKQLHDRLETFKPLRIKNAVYIPAWMTTVDEICEVAGLDAGAVERWNGDYFVIECIPEPS